MTTYTVYYLEPMVPTIAVSKDAVGVTADQLKNFKEGIFESYVAVDDETKQAWFIKDGALDTEYPNFYAAFCK